MKVKVTDPQAPLTKGAYSPALRFGDWIFISGQGPLNPKGEIINGDVTSEARLTLQNIRTLVEAAGGSMDQIVKCNCYLITMDDFEKFDAVYREFFADPRPCRTTVAAGLLGIKVEIDAIAYIGR